MAAIRIGCSGWNYRSWAGDLYPKGCPPSRWLEVYSSEFDAVEVNATFYRLPNRDAVARWVEQTPPGFIFAVKSSRYLTHMKRLTDMDRGVERLLERIEPLVESPKMGPMLWQLPDRHARDDERLAYALERLPPHIAHAFELRHPSWHDPDVLDMLRAHGVAWVIHHDPRRAEPPHELTADFVYVRLHYGARGRRGNYSAAELASWAARIREWAREASVFAFLNNDWEGFAPRNARELIRATS